jgi:serine/threonine-protein kinase
LRGRLIVGDSSAPSAPSSTGVPDRVGRYEILLPIASGGMATVYLARAVGSSGFVTEVALKLTHAHLRASAEFANDLVEEGKLAARIRHRNVVSVIDVGDDPHGLYLVLEYIEGDTLAGLIRGADAIPTPMAARLLLDALAGLHAAHELREDDGSLVGVVHRDFTPQNILVGADGVARLADFGIAKAATRIGHTRTGMIKGKIAYMAPEQAHGLPLDRRCDVWAAGVVAWELFAGRRLHGHGDDLATMLKVATLPPPLLGSVSPEVPVGIEAAVAGALEMRLDDRFPTAQAFSKALAAACRATVGVAEIDEVAAWMKQHVGPKLAARRKQVAGARALCDEKERTRRETPVVVEATVDPRRGAPTELLPTVASAQEPRQLTDGVSVMGRGWRTARSLAVGRRAIAGGGILAALLILSVAAWRMSTGHRDVPTAGTPVASSALAASSTTVPGSSATPAAPAAPTLRLRANAAIASLRVNGHSIPVARPAFTVDVGLAGLDQEPSLSIDAVANDGRRAEVAVPTGAAEVSLEFPQRPLPQGLPVRTAGPRRPAQAAPLASSPYN